MFGVKLVKQASTALGMGTTQRRVTYADYLHVHQLIELQDGHCEREISCDEHHFIIVHQAFELWFCRIINEMRDIRNKLNKPEVPENEIPKIVAGLERITEIFRLLQSQWKVMETLTPQGFLDFRDELGTASGFESFQMRELEILLGIEYSDRPNAMNPIEHFSRLAHESDTAKSAYERLLAASEEVSLKQALHTWLGRTPIHGSSPNDAGDGVVVREFVEQHLATMARTHEIALAHFEEIGQQDLTAVKSRFAASLEGAREYLLPEGEIERSRAGLLFIESYRELPLLSWPRALIDSTVELEESIILFRTHHARMVERMIGRRVGTGGSSGVDYLDMTTKMRVFTDLWAVRTILLKRSDIAPVSQPETYGFKR